MRYKPYTPTPSSAQWKGDGKHRRRKNVEADVGNWLSREECEWKGKFRASRVGWIFHFLHRSAPTPTQVLANLLSRKNVEWKKEKNKSGSVCEKQTKKKSESEYFLHFSNPNLDGALTHTNTLLRVVLYFPSSWVMTLDVVARYDIFILRLELELNIKNEIKLNFFFFVSFSLVILRLWMNS